MLTAKGEGAPAATGTPSMNQPTATRQGSRSRLHYCIRNTRPRSVSRSRIALGLLLVIVPRVAALLAVVAAMITLIVIAGSVADATPHWATIAVCFAVFALGILVLVRKEG